MCGVAHVNRLASGSITSAIAGSDLDVLAMESDYTGVSSTVPTPARKYSPARACILMALATGIASEPTYAIDEATSTRSLSAPACLTRQLVQQHRHAISALSCPEAQEALSTIRAAFGLNITQTAQVLGVTRPTIYSWLAGDGTPRAGNEDRLRRLVSLAMYWTGRSSSPLGKRLRNRVSERATLLDLLSTEALDMEEIRAVLRVNARQEQVALNKEPQARARVLAQGRAHKRDNARVAFDVFTGKRISSD